jgi:hypothetical protein
MGDADGHFYTDITQPVSPADGKRVPKEPNATRLWRSA